MQPRRAMLPLGLLLLFGSLIGATLRVVSLERKELEHETGLVTLEGLMQGKDATRISVRITEVKLGAGERALFELCSEDGFDPKPWRGAVEFMIWRPSVQKLERRIALDNWELARAKRGRGGACLTLGSGFIEAEGVYALEAVFKKPLPPQLRKVGLRARVLASQPLSRSEGLLVLGASFGAMLTVLSGFSGSSARRPIQRGAVVWAILGTLLAMALATEVMRLPIPGSAGGLARGMLLASVEALVACLAARMIYGRLRLGLALFAPSTVPALWLFAAVLCAVALNPVARWALNVIPASGEAPIETFISWPSGALAFATLGMVVPLAEELFFRGFVFGALEPNGKARAWLGTVVLFTAAHAPQAWGNWGALLSITITGFVLTALRAMSGSTLVPAVAHLLYNLSLWRDSFGG